MNKSGAVLIIGAGVGGIRASLDLAEAGFRVYLCDRSPSIGGTLIKLDKWFPDNHCGMCQMLPTFFLDSSSQFCLRRGLIHPNIELMPLTEVTEVEGEAGNFRITLNSKATGVNPQLCIGCGLCAEVCPVETANEFNKGLAPRKAIYVPTPYLVPHIYSIDWGSCTECGACVDKCPTQSIQLQKAEMVRQLEVGAIILATGFEEFDPTLATQYGYKRYPNVITSLELERILSSSGPSGGGLVRPSDRRVPKSVAFLQCVGSRNEAKNYCSSTCCMVAVKEATLLKQAYPQIDVHIFFIDFRAFGKGHHRYYEQARDQLGVKFARSRIPVIKEEPQTKDLILTTIGDNGALVRRQFELVVLSVSQTPVPRFQALCQTLGIETNRWGFCQTGLFSPVDTSRDGIYVCGCASAPKDIADTIIEASAAAYQTAKWLAQQRAQPVSTDEPDKLTLGDELRLGIFLCSCGTEITSVLDFAEITKFCQQLPNVAYIEEIPYLCQGDALVRLGESVSRHKINRVVIGACTTLLDAHLLKYAKDIELSPRLIQKVNLREQVTWVHRENPKAATEKAKSLLAIGIEAAKSQEFLPVSAVTVQPRALVIGAGLAGLTTALSIAQQGFEVHLVEKSAELGGNLKHVYYTLEGRETQTFLKNLITQVKANHLIHLATETEVSGVQGYAGNFEISLRGRNSGYYSLEVGAIIVATGGEQYRPTEYLYGQDKRVITQTELERKLFSAELDSQSLKSVVMIQCVGSREKERPYCSRICCSQALKNALRLKKENANTEVIILYRDIMSYGFKEEYYAEAREKGVIFARYELDGKPKIRQEGNRLVLEVAELVLGGRLVLEPDLAVLSPAIVPSGNTALAQILSVALDEDGFFREAENKFRPLEFLAQGIFVCGLAHSPRGIEESIVQAQAVAQRVVALLGRQRLESGRFVSEIIQRRCRKCELCVKVCPYFARLKDTEKDEVVVREVLCQGCGVCVVACPSGAAKLRGFKNKQVFSVIDAAFST